MIHEGTVDAAVFKEFLKRLMIGATKPVFVVNGHSIHKSKLVREYVASLQGMLKLFYLPPYSPHLNPYEQVWAHVKRQVSKQFVQGKTDMKRLALGALPCLKHQIAQLMFQTTYTAEGLSPRGMAWL